MDISMVLLHLLSTQITNADADISSAKELTPEEMTALFALSQRHDLAHIVRHALSNLGLLGSDEISKKFKQQAVQAFYRYAQMDHAYGQVCGVLEEQKIPFIPLKGAVLRDYYPEPWMRTSCDIDILVKEEDLDKAIAALREQLQYTAGYKSDHDVAMNSPNGVRLEMHYDTIRGRFTVNNCRDVLARIWEDAVPKEPGAYHYRMSDAMFYFYHITHMAKHFRNGGCGVRPFLDLWIMNNRMDFDRQKRYALLEEGGLLKFAIAAEHLSEVWLSGGEANALSRQMEDFILDGGVYGTVRNSMAVDQIRMGSKLKYACSKIFLPYDVLKYDYPILQKKPWLTPLYEVKRWKRLISADNGKYAMAYLKTNAKISSTESVSTAEMLKQLGM